MLSRQRKRQFIKALFRLLLPLLVLLGALWLLVSFYIVYQLRHPESMAEAVDPSSYLLPFKEFSWNGSGDVSLKAWYIPAKPTSPVIFLCHGYGSNRSRLLSLAERLYASGFSCVVLGLRGHGQASRLASSLGWLEAADLLAARDELLRLKWLSKQKLGAWGVDIGAFAALTAASRDGHFRALLIDNGFLSMDRYLDYQATAFSGKLQPVLAAGIRKAFVLAAGGGLLEDVPSVQMDKLREASVMMLVSEKEPARSSFVEELQRQLPSQSVTRLKQTRADDLNGPALQEYDNRVASFFQSVNWQ